MRSLMPRWMREFPFADQIDFIYHLSLVVAALGVMGALMGVVGGLVLALPFALLVFLLWRTYIDDGYKEGGDG